MSIKKHDDQEYSVSFADPEAGIVNLGDASHIVLEHGDYDTYLGLPRENPPEVRRNHKT